MKAALARPLIEVYTTQKNAVVERLSSGECHIQPWLASAAYETGFGIGWRVAHKRAYFFVMHEYTARMGHQPLGAPVWVGFGLKRQIEMHDSEWKRELKLDEKIIVLRVPREELLVTDYTHWDSHVLRGACLDHNSDMESMRKNRCACAGRRRRESWRGIFTLPQDPAAWQAILDHLDPRWAVWKRRRRFEPLAAPEN